MTHKGLVTLQLEYPFLDRKHLQNKTSVSAKLTWHIKEWGSSVPRLTLHEKVSPTLQGKTSSLKLMPEAKPKPLAI